MTGRVCLLVDKPNWAFDISARQLQKHLARDFEIDIRYVVDDPDLSPQDYDILHIFFWGENIHRPLGFSPAQIIKEVSSHRWQDDPAYGPCTPAQFVERYLDDCATAVCTSRRLWQLVAPHFPDTYRVRNGIDAELFSPPPVPRQGPLVIGWAGNIHDAVKGYTELVEPACDGRFSLVAATGGVSHREMAEFYRRIDVLAVSSRHEGEPLPLIEAMACGCFPVCVDVGVVPELVAHARTGYVVAERTPEAFRQAFQWCAEHLDQIRAAREPIAQRVARDWNWTVCAPSFRKAYERVLWRAQLERRFHRLRPVG